MNTISPTDLRDRVTADHKLLLLDVREAHELSSELGHIDNIAHIPLGELPSKLVDLKQHQDKTIVAICKMGGRAAKAAEYLEHSGFQHVIVLDGGMISWNECGLPVLFGKQ